MPRAPLRRPAHPPAAANATAADSAFGRALLQGLAQTPHTIAPKFFYDERGSRLFDRICALEEYYPTRCEMAILATHAREIAHHIGAQADLIEFGAGSLRKIRLLLDALDAPARFVPIDISAEHLQGAAAILRTAYPALDVHPLAADFTAPLALPPRLAGRGKRVGFFPGSSIGNFSPAEAHDFLRMAAHLLRGGGLLVGVDLVKDPALLHCAYNDAAGMTAAFNLNLLERANRELGADFDPRAFAHYAFYAPLPQRIEMHLVSLRDQLVSVCGQGFALREGESLHTENSYKYTAEQFRALARAAGFMPGPVWCDPQRRFSVHWLAAPSLA